MWKGRNVGRSGPKMKAEVRDAAIKCGRVPWNFARLLLESRGGFSSRSRKQVERTFS